MNFEELITKLDFDNNANKSKNQTMGIWFPDLDFGFCLHIKGSDVHFIHRYSEDVDLSITLNHDIWKKITSGRLNPYDAILTGKVNYIGDRWDVIQFFEKFT
jgi:putative sterol carrier protein